jgi:hypothetical protein
MATLSCVLQCRMVRVGRAAQLGSDQSTVQLQRSNGSLARFIPVPTPQEANYAHQQELDMIPLMMQKEYSPKGYGGNDRLPWAPLHLCSRDASWLTSR